jgi:flagellar export protein FliJ
MKKSQRMDPLITLARQQEKKLAGWLNKSRNRCSAQEVQLTELNTYRAQYWTALLPGQGEIGAGQLKNLWRFLGKLDEAISQGVQRATQSREKYLRDQQTFMSARSRTKVLEELRIRYRLQEQRTEMYRERKEHDENAQRMVAHRQGTTVTHSV